MLVTLDVTSPVNHLSYIIYIYILYVLIELRFGRVWSSPSSVFQFASSDTTVVRKTRGHIYHVIIIIIINTDR